MLREDVKHVEDLFVSHPSPHSNEPKEYFVSKYLEVFRFEKELKAFINLIDFIKASWFKAHGYCAAHGMKLAEFNTIEEYYSVVVAIVQDSKSLCVTSFKCIHGFFCKIKRSEPETFGFQPLI